MDYENLDDEKLQAKLDEAILNADPSKLDDEELDRRLYLRESGHNAPDLLSGMADAAGDLIGMAGTVADYPMGIARSAVSGVHDVFSKEKSPMEALESVGSAFAGPSNAPSAQSLAEKVGIPATPIPGTNIPQSAVAGFGIDSLMGIGEAKAIGEGAKLAGRGIRNLVNADELALKATGTRSKDFQGMIHDSPVSDPMKGSREYANYAAKNFIRPFNDTEKLLKKVGIKWEETGKEIGNLRKKNAGIVEKWLKSNPDNAEVKTYVKNSFNPRSSLNRVFEEIDKSIPSPRAADQVKDIVGKELEALHLKYQGKEIPIDEISKLKTYWQNEVNFGKDAADYSLREAANNFLQREANRAIDNEFEFADKWLKGSDKVKHSKLKEEYGTISRMYSNIASKAAREGAERSNVLTSINPINNTRLQTAISSIPNDPINFMPGRKSVVSGGAIGGAQVPNMRPGGYKEPLIEGFRISETRPVNPMEAQMLNQEIQKSELSNTEKARRMNLMNKHGLIYIGQ